MKQPNEANENSRTRRPLLDLESGNRPGLQRAMQHLVGRKAAPDALAINEAVLQILTGLGFEIASQADVQPVRLTHPFAEGRMVALELPPSSGKSPESLALEFAAAHFPEMEYYLPYITARARYQAALKKNRRPAPLGPEPDYDEDGFLAGS